jgi:hypothetical protein
VREGSSYRKRNRRGENIIHQTKLTDFADRKEKEQPLDRESDLAAEQLTNGEFVLKGVAKIAKRRRTK